MGGAAGAVLEEYHARYLNYLRELGRSDPARAREVARLKYDLFLSDPASARPGGVYFCGLKPYGAPRRSYDFPAPPPPGYLAYRDGGAPATFSARARHVIRLALDATLGPATPPEAALCTNWYFQRAADTAQLRRFGLDRLDASDLHRRLLGEYRPRLILCVGNGPVSAYAGMLALFATETTTNEVYAGTARLKRAAPPGGPLIVGLPHLSRYGVGPVKTPLIKAVLTTDK